MSKIAAIVLVLAGALALIIFLIWKNNKDKKLINPDAQDTVEEAINDQESRRESL